MSAADVLPSVRLKKRRALPFFNRHPWVFAGAIADVPADLAPGTEVMLRSESGQWIARGLFNPHSNIRVRLYCWDTERPLDEAFWAERIDGAISLRERLYSGPRDETACRMIFSEADGLSGLTVDRYGDWLLLQVTSLALAMRRETIVKILSDRLRPKGIWLRTEKGIRESEGLEAEDGLLFGEAPPRPLFIEEHGIRYGVDVAEGQKTGFFLDQRDNRLAAARYAMGPRLLDAFCYTGGFGLTILKHGPAREVLGVDVSDSALQLAQANAELNGLAERTRFRKGRVDEVLTELAESQERFGTIILDPPKMARTRKGLERAMKGYQRLNSLALNLLEPGGTLVTCSCSGLVSRDEFLAILAAAATQTDRHLQVLEFRGGSADHPASIHCLENAYLKCAVCRVV